MDQENEVKDQENAEKLSKLQVEIDAKDSIIREKNKSIEDMQKLEKELRI